MRPERFTIDYGFTPRPESLVEYDFSILDPDSPASLDAGHARGKRFYGYISGSEIGPSENYRTKAIDFGVQFLGRNETWDSDIVDVNDTWIRFVVEVLGKEVVAKGYDGFFLDTMDSYFLLDSLEARLKQEEGLVKMVKALNGAYPDKKIILNRGFPLLGRLAGSVHGFLCEGLYYSHGGEPNEAEDTEELISLLMPISKSVPVYIVDYVGDKKWVAPDVVSKILDLGFSPLVVGHDLDGTALGMAPALPVAPSPIPAQKRAIIWKGHIPVKGGKRSYRFTASANAGYEMEWAPTKKGPWTVMERVPPAPARRVVTIVDSASPPPKGRIYQLVKVLQK